MCSMLGDIYIAYIKQHTNQIHSRYKSRSTKGYLIIYQRHIYIRIYIIFIFVHQTQPTVLVYLPTNVGSLGGKMLICPPVKIPSLTFLKPGGNPITLENGENIRLKFPGHPCISPMKFSIKQTMYISPRPQNSANF